MEQSEPSLVPQWLKNSGSVSREASINSQLTSSPYSDHITYSVCRRSSSSKGSGYSRSYSSSGRRRHDRDWEKDTDNFFDKDKLDFGRHNHDHYDYVDNLSANRFEKDQLQHSQSMTSGRWGETWSGRSRTAGDLSNSQRNHDKSDGMVTAVVDIMPKTLFEEEFPLLGAEDKQGGSESGRVLSSGSGTSSQSLLTGTSAVSVGNGLTSALHEIPVTVGSNSMAAMLHHTVSASSSSFAPGTMGLSMAETLAQGPSRSHTPPQLSVGKQKLEELALKQSRLLIPMTPSVPRTLAVSPSEKSKVKTGKQQYPLYSRPPSHSSHGGPANSDLPKITSGNSRNVSASRELNGVFSAAKDSLSPHGNRVLSPVGAATSTSINAPSRNSSNNTSPAMWTTLEKRPTSQNQSRTDFFKNLSRKSSLKNPSSDAFPTSMSCASEKSEVVTRNVTGWLSLKSGEAPSADTSGVNSLTESNGLITENGNTSSEPLKFSSNGAQLLSTTPVLYPEEEEIAFLRSLGWEESAGEDESLTEEEIRDFCEKYMKLQPSSNIFHKVHQKMIALPVDSSSGECGEAPSGLRPSAWVNDSI